MTTDVRVLTGVWVDVLIPLTPDLLVDHVKLATHIRTLGVKGVAGVVLFGPAGEGAAFSAAERLDTVKQLLAHGVSGNDIVLHVGFASLTETVALIQQAQQLHLRGCIVTPPHADEEPAQEGLSQYFNQVAARTADIAPRLFLATPLRAGKPELTPPVISEVLGQHAQHYVGLIDQTRNATHVQDWIRLFAAKLPLYANHELQATALAKLGMHTCVSSYANLMPSVISSLVTPPGQLKVSVTGAPIGPDEAPLLQLAHLLEGLPEVPALKFLMSLQYHDPDWHRVRPPQSTLLPQSQERLSKEFKKHFPSGHAG